MRILAGAALALLIPALGRCAIWYQPFTTSTTETPLSPKVVATNNGNYSISFVPLITLLSGIIPRLISRIRTPTTESRDLADTPTPSPSVPNEFNGANPCIDSILVRRAYPGNSCYFYQCELYEPSSPICRLQVLQDPDSPTYIDYTTVERKSSLLRISDCLAIRLYRCLAGYVYDKSEKKCVQSNPYTREEQCVS
uniref:Uncharacterized protein n=2 Tax=Lygus hesperus TaxID=30085 RepID=A0A146L807_LYGHE